MTTAIDDQYALPLQGREERRQLYEWMAKEEEYVAGKFDDDRDGHDSTLRDGYHLDHFWRRQIVQYLDRAQVFLTAAYQAEGDDIRRAFELRAQQALAKGMMTFKGCVESSIRVYGPLPKAGAPSGEIEPRATD